MNAISEARRSITGKLFAIFAVAALSMAVPAEARAQWPQRPITLVVCFPAGGGTDIAMRMINTQLGEALGQPVIVENRGGAGGNIAIAAVARATPDGHTLLGCSSAFVVNTSLYASANYEPLKDFAPVMLLGAAPNVIVVPGKSDIKTFQDFIARVKANPGKLNWTSSGVGTTPHLGIELLKQRLGLDIVHIPFAGAGPATQAAAAGQVDVYTANLGSLGAHIAGGTFRAIAQTGKERWAGLRDVPTLDELGIKDAEADTFQAIHAPAGTPREVIDRLVKEINTILARPDIKEKYLKSGLGVVAESGDAFKARIAREVAMYKGIIDKAGLKVK